MGRTRAEILTDLAAYVPCPDPKKFVHQWSPVLELVEELESAHWLADAIPEVVAVFERSPEARMVGGAWYVEYALYRHPGHFERPLVESLLRRPSDFTVRVLCRMLCRGQTRIGPWSIRELLEGVVVRADVPDALRALARKYLQWPEEGSPEPDAVRSPLLASQGRGRTVPPAG
jgi:hypothetical protein